MQPNARHHWFGGALIAIGVVCTGWYALAAATASRVQRQERALLASQLARARESPAPPRESPAPPPRLVTGELLGKLDIPRVRLSVMVVEGDDDGTLKGAVGHLPDTAVPWSDGHAVLAGHRDGFFSPLQRVRVGDDIRLTSAHGTFVYSIRDLRVVGPNDLSVLDPAARDTLTLITCYPFYYVGSAPNRFIVRAERVERSAVGSDLDPPTARSRPLVH